MFRPESSPHSGRRVATIGLLTLALAASCAPSASASPERSPTPSPTPTSSYHISPDHCFSVNPKDGAVGVAARNGAYSETAKAAVYHPLPNGQTAITVFDNLFAVTGLQPGDQLCLIEESHP